MKFDELMQKDAAELRKLCAELKREHMNLRIRVRTTQDVKTAAMRTCRKDAARVLTRLSQLERGEEPKKAADRNEGKQVKQKTGTKTGSETKPRKASTTTKEKVNMIEEEAKVEGN